LVHFITGKAKSGKTTFAYKLAFQLTKEGYVPFIFDGDEVREHLPTGFSDKDRQDHIMRIAAFAAIAEKQGFVPIIALVSPKRCWRIQARKIFKESILYYMPGGELWSGSSYEEPNLYEFSLNAI